MMERRIINIQFTMVCTLTLLGAVLSGCYYDVEEKLYPNECNTETVTYSGTVLPIIEGACYTCHDALTQNGGVNLEGYDQFLVWVANGKVLTAIKHEGQFPMPEDAAKLDSCTIAKIEKWIDAGALEN